MGAVLAKRALTPFPGQAVPDIQLGVKLSRVGSDALEIEYVVTGDVAAIRVADLAVPERRDELWRTTCFEAFVRPRGGKAYREYNLAPSRDYAIYDFDNYREGMRNALDAPQPRIFVENDRQSRLAVTAVIDPQHWWTTGSRWGITAVIEDRAGGVSHWALAHPDAQPDFHDPSCFTLELPAPKRA